MPICKNIEALSSKTIVDMWDQICMSQSPKFLMFGDNISFRLRMLGDFMISSRHYIPSELKLEHVVTKDQLEDIVKGNETIYKTVIDSLFAKLDETTKVNVMKYRAEVSYNLSESKANNKMMVNDADALTIKRIKEIDSIFASSTWPKCYLVNVIIREINFPRNGILNGDVGILPVTMPVLDGIYSSAKTLYGDKLASMKIGGTVAHDLHISRTSTDGRPNRRNQRHQQKNYAKYNWAVNMSPSPDSLTQPEITTILKYGLFDLAEAARFTNRTTATKRVGFLYRVYKMTMNNKDMISEILSDYESDDSDQHIKLADQHITDLPEMAFSNRQPAGAIGSLEL